MEQTILSGLQGLDKLLDGEKVLLVSTGLSRYPEIKRVFDSANCITFSGFTPNPLYEQVAEGVRIFNAENCSIIAAVGGGSAIDVAKCIKLFCRMDKAVNFLEQKKADTGIPLIAIPTTAGTGSESTCHAVCYYNGEKQSISHPSIVPDYAFLVPSVLYSLPVYQKKCTLLDALCQAIESWWSLKSTDESVEYSRRAIELIHDNWQSYILDSSLSAAEQIQLAANLSGRAISITATTAAHAMSYKITSLYKLPHGHAVAVCMLKVWKYILDNIDSCTDSRGTEHLRAVFSKLPVDLEWFCSLMSALEITSPVSFNREEELELLTASVNPIRLGNTPVPMDKAALKSMYEKIVS